MFLCDDCHADSTCVVGRFEVESVGVCERCRDLGLPQWSTITTDCHGYNFSGLSEAEIEAKVAEVMAGGDRSGADDNG